MMVSGLRLLSTRNEAADQSFHFADVLKWGLRYPDKKVAVWGQILPRVHGINDINFNGRKHSPIYQFKMTLPLILY